MPARLLFLSALSLLSAPAAIARPGAPGANGDDTPPDDEFAGDVTNTRVSTVSETPRAETSSVASAPWTLPSTAEIWRRPMPFLPRWRQRLILRCILTAFGKNVRAVHGIEHLSRENDAFIVALNHSTRIEAVLLPILFAFARQGSLISFLADWNFALIPGLATILRDGEVILLARKDAKPAFLNVFKPLFQKGGSAFDRASRALHAGRSIGVFPEGTTNRHPTRLLKGFDGTARLSLTTGKPVIPVGVRFPGHPPHRPIQDRAPMELFIGEPLRPPDPAPDPPRSQLRAWHERIMRDISRLSGKEWSTGATRKKHHGLD